jgi:histidinol phosphatase-like PHP family hydrolase
LPLPPVFDFHTHTLLSDGELVPAELARRVKVAGYEVLGLADHADHGCLAEILAAARASALALAGHLDGLTVLPGVEITHVPPVLLGDLVRKARDLGASHVVVHGESPVDPVAPGTNLAAIEAGADLLAHPGHLTEKEAALAAEKGVFLELSLRGGHGLANGRVARLARKYSAGLLVSSDGHMVGEYLTPELQRATALGAGLNEEEFADLLAGAARLAETARRRLDL